MQEMIELSSQQQKEQQLPPRAVQIVSHPFFGRVVLTAGPAQFGMDLSKHKAGVIRRCICDLFLAFCYFPYCISLNFTVLVLFQGGQLEGDQLITVVRMAGHRNDRTTAVTVF